MENNLPQDNDQEIEEKPISNRYFYIAAGIIIILMLGVFFGAGYIFSIAKTDRIDYNNFVFTKSDDLWHTQWQGADKILYALSFRNNPYEVENVPIIGTLNTTFNNRKIIHVTFDPLADKEEFKYIVLAESELLLNLIRALDRNITIGCITNASDACANVPVVTCDDQTKSVIYLKSDGPTQILLNNTCVTLQGEDKELIKPVERILYQWYKIIR